MTLQGFSEIAAAAVGPDPTLVVNVQQVPPAQRHTRIFTEFLKLQPGQAIDLLNDHNPWPLRQQFEANLQGLYSWHEMHSGPDHWRVRIVRLAASSPSGSCCGGCCGA